MHDSVRDAFITVAAAQHGRVNYMRCNADRLVVTGVGIYLPDPAAAQRLGWRWRDTNKKATAKEISAEWVAIRSMGQQGPSERGDSYFARYAQLMLPDVEITRSAMDKLNLIEWRLTEHLPKDYRHWPADAQMAVLQLAWSRLPIPNLEDQNWLSASGKVDDALAKRLFRNAHLVEERQAIKSKFYYLSEPSLGIVTK